MSAGLAPVNFGAPIASPLGVPVGGLSWEVKTTLDTTAHETEAVQWEIKAPCLITSFRPSVVFRATPLVYVPDILEYLEVSLVLDNDWLITNETNQMGGTPVIGAYITLGSIGPSERLWSLKCLAATPRMRAAFRSKVGTPGASSGLPAPAIISVTALGWYLDSRGTPITERK